MVRSRGYDLKTQIRLRKYLREEEQCCVVPTIFMNFEGCLLCGVFGVEDLLALVFA